MVTRRRNKTVYTGAVGAKMRPVNLKTKRRPVIREHLSARGGPLDGKTLRLEAGSGGNTLTFTLRGQTGRYTNGAWEEKR